LYCETSGFLSSVKRIHCSTTNRSSSLSFLKGSIDSHCSSSSITTAHVTTLNSSNYIGSNKSYRADIMINRNQTMKQLLAEIRLFTIVCFCKKKGNLSPLSETSRNHRQVYSESPKGLLIPT
jgi:hypothetical protein